MLKAGAERLVFQVESTLKSTQSVLEGNCVRVSNNQ
jgi:hypothetical protein